jgi:hypothetical protein
MYFFIIHTIPMSCFIVYFKIIVYYYKGVYVFVLQMRSGMCYCIKRFSSKFMGMASARTSERYVPDLNARSPAPPSCVCPPTSRLLRPLASTWGSPTPVGTASAFPHLTARRDSRKAMREMQHSI